MTDIEEEEDLNAKCTADVKPMLRSKRGSPHKEEDSETIDIASGSDSDYLKIFDTLGDFRLLCLLSKWREPETRSMRLIVAILLPSGVGKARGMLFFQVASSGLQVELTIKWPKPMTCPKVVHWSKLREGEIESTHPSIRGFEDALRMLRSRFKDSMESVTFISLPFKVESHVAEHDNNWFKDCDVRIWYIQLKGSMQSYAVDDESASFTDS